MNCPANPIAAATHPDPYPYYAELVARRPIYHDATLGLWVASSAQTVEAVLRSELCRVRPPAEPVPLALLGSPAAEIFRHLVRMNDGDRHCPFKQAVSAALNAIDDEHAGMQSARSARLLCAQLAPQADAARIANFALQLPVHVMASLLGVAPDDLPQTAQSVGAFVAGITPGADSGRIAQGKLAAENLLALFHALLPSQTEGLLATLAREARQCDRADANLIIANAIGFMSQSYEATAGLIGNTLCALGARPALRAQIDQRPALLSELIQEVLRTDPPIQNTRRFVAVDGIVAGQQMRAGDAILVLLAAANRDPAVNPEPDRFDLLRRERQCFGFGRGAHACPGDMLAATIAQAGIAGLLAAGVDPAALYGTQRYRASLNARIPMFGTTDAESRTPLERIA